MSIVLISCSALLLAAQPPPAGVVDTAPAPATGQPLTLRDALQKARSIDPTLQKARTTVDRAHLGALRAQLDRVSFTVDGQVQELWNKSNLFGATLHDCRVGASVMQLDPAACAALGGVSTVADAQSPYAQQGLFNASAQLTVPLFTGFRVSANASRADFLEEAAAQSLQSAQRDLDLAVVRAYWSVRRLALLAEVQRQTLARLAEAERVTGARVKAGLAPAIDSNRAVLRRLQAQDALADYAGQEREAGAQLATTLGIAEDVLLTDDPTFPDSEPPPVDALLTEARSRRSELAAARFERMAQEQAVRVARSGYFPELDAFGLFQYGNNPYITGSGARDVASTSVANPFKDMAGDLTAGLTLNWNVFDMLQTYTSTRDAMYQLALAQAEERRVARDVEAQLRVARAKVEHLAARHRALAAAREVARDNREILRTRYQSGDAMVIEYLDAEVELANAELQLVGVTAELQVAWTELHLAAGGAADDSWQTVLQQPANAAPLHRSEQ